MTEIGTIIDGKYEILKEIGRGGMSTVYLAMDSHLNKQWAVKEIRKKGTGANDEIVVNSLLAEANLMKRLDHPALPRIVDIIDNGITIYVVMDYIEGESLDKILKEYGVQDEERVIEWAKQICDALSYLHSQKPRPIVYRDMKPANIMLKPEGNIKIIDFGIAREYKEQNLADTKVLGTRGFAPPEAYNGQTTPRSDIYSLGMTMHNLLTGVDPRMGDGYVPVRQLNPNLSEGIELIIDKCVQPAEENRYQSCADLIYDLEHPDLITSGYKKKQKRKLIATIVPFVLSVLMAFSGLGTAIGASIAKTGSYKDCVNQGRYAEAISKYPDKYDEEKYTAYEEMISYYERNAKTEKGFTEEDYATLKEKIWTVYGKKLREGNPEKYADISYRIGKLCIMDLRLPIDDRVNEASTYFEDVVNLEKELKEANKTLDFADKEKNRKYHELCEYQSKMSNMNNVEEPPPTYEENIEFLKTVNELLDELESDPETTEFAILSFNEMAYSYLIDNMTYFANTGVDKQEVLDLAKRINDLSYSQEAQKPMLKKLKDAVILDYPKFEGKLNLKYSKAKINKVKGD